MRSFVKWGVRICICLVIVAILGGVFFVLQRDGIVWFNMPSRAKYPVVGVDVSAHQGSIDWAILSKQNIHFVFIKATEGSSWVDKRFAYNFENAKKQNLYVGAYHFFSFESSGKTQAQNFINTVPLPHNRQERLKFLPPVIDMEFYGAFAKLPLEPQSVHKKLNDLLHALESHYGTKPIIYTTPSFYSMYLRDQYQEYPLWIRSIFFAPDSLWARMFDVYFTQWKFWQYNPKGILKGYKGGEKYIDLNVYQGSLDDLNQWLREAYHIKE